MKLFLLAAAVLVIVIAWGFGVFGQEPPPHSWIQQGPFTSANGAHCCGPEHCRPIDPGAIAFTGEGAVVRWWNPGSGTLTETKVPRAAIYPTQDPAGAYWFCTTGCLFLGTDA